MKPVSALLSLSAIVSLASMTAITTVDARPMHAGINYERYLAESDKINGELDKWMEKYGKDAEANGWLPQTESRSADEIQEDRKQRFFMAKELVSDLEKANPDAQFTTDSPFSLMTTEEFAKYIRNSYIAGDGRRLRAQDEDVGAQSPKQQTPGKDDTSGNEGDDGKSPDFSNWHSFSFQDLIDWITKNGKNKPTPTPKPNPGPGPTPNPSTQPTPTSNKPMPSPSSQPSSRPPSRPTKTPSPGPGPNPVGPVAPTGTPAPGPKPDDNTGGEDLTVDWSKNKCMAPIQNQGQCGSCWAFATVSAVETGQCLKNKGTLVKYSEQHVTGCDRNGSNGCNGGIPTYALQFIQKGVCTAESAPYKASNQCVSCSPVQTGMTGQQPVKGDNGLVSALGTNPVVMAVAAGNNAWKQYRGGVLSTCDTTRLDHAVVAVGYDATSIKIRNSWGTGWGEQGYIRIKRSSSGNGVCGMYQNLIRPTF